MYENYPLTSLFKEINMPQVIDLNDSFINMKVFLYAWRPEISEIN